MKAMKFIRSNPHLPVKNLRQTLDYYRDTLGFYDEWTWPDKDGKVVDGGIRRDEMRLLFGEDPDFTVSGLTLMWFVGNICSV
jgi:catechol 2,3-dioxygenase-like lactoylglutathione lyase family enzyme